MPKSLEEALRCIYIICIKKFLVYAYIFVIFSPLLNLVRPILCPASSTCAPPARWAREGGRKYTKSARRRTFWYAYCTLKKNALVGSWEIKLGANGGFTKISKSAGSIQRMICWWPKTRGDERKCPSCKCRVRFLCSSPKLISQLTGAPSCNNVSSCGPQNPKSSKASGVTNSEEDICRWKVVTLDLNLSIQTNNALVFCKRQ